MFNINFAIAFLLSFVISLLIVPLVIRFSKKINIIDDPKKNKHPKVIHTYPVPRGGGLGIFIAILISALLVIPIDKHLLGILVGALFITILGIADDKFNINPYIRLIAQFFIAAIPIATGIGIAFITNPLGGIIDLSTFQINYNFLGNHSIWVLSDLFALAWIVGLMNLINIGAKGVDGQLPGVVGIAAIIISILSLGYSADIAQWPVIFLSLVTAGAFLGFLPWNFYPQKIMPSYSGSTLGGYLLAILAILTTAKVGTLIVILGIPIIDTIYVFTRRILMGRSPVWGDASHLHHRLLKAGWGKRRVTVFYWIITLFLGIIAINLNASQKLYTIIAVAIFLAAFTYFLTNKYERG